MKHSDIAVLALRLMAIYILTLYLAIVGMAGLYGSGMGASKWSWFLLITLVYLGLSGFLFIFAPRLADRFVYSPTESGVDLRGQISENSETFVYQLVGVIVLISAVPALVHALTQAAYPLFVPADSVSIFQYMVQNWQYLVAPIVKLVIGVVLTLRPSGLKKLMRKLRPMSG